MFKSKITFDRFIRWVIVALIVLAVFFTLNYLSDVLLPFFIAWFLAYLLFPVVKFIEVKMHVRIRAVAIIMAMVLCIAVLTGVVMMVVPPMIEQFQSFSGVAINYMHNITRIESFPQAIEQWISQNNKAIESFLRSPDFTNLIKNSAPQLFKFINQSANVLMKIAESLITLLYMFFILLDYEYLTNHWLKIFPAENRPFMQDLEYDVEHAMNSYIRGQGTVALIMGILFCIGFTIIGLPIPIGMGILVGVLDLVPYLHTFAIIPAGILMLMKAADTGQNFWVLFALVIVVFAVVQIIIEAIVNPRILGKAMGMNPAVLLLSLSIWGSLLGMIGLIIALPMTTIIMAYWQRYVTQDVEIPKHQEQKDTSQ